MVSLVDRRGAEKRHHEPLHLKVEREAENDADDDRPRPTFRPHITDVAPWCARKLRPHQNKNRVDRGDQEVARKDEKDRKNSERPESAQRRSAAIIRGRWIGRSVGRCYFTRLRRHFLTTHKGLRVPPRLCRLSLMLAQNLGEPPHFMKRIIKRSGR